MRFLRRLFPLVVLLVSSSTAFSDQANDALSHISTFSKMLDENQDAVNRYNGGIVAASPLAHGMLNIWTSLREANSNLQGTKFTPQESSEIVGNLTAANEASLNVLDAYREKAPLLNQAGVGFMVPIFMQALYREADDFTVGLKKQMPQKYAASMDQITARHRTAWDETFQSYESASKPNPLNHKRFFSMVSPVLGLLI
ncbi:uncharacterized protein N7446_003112 [Penicillium canescens]|uniref:Uncharacterized protein n=1 Tax=Penicillium canescens TaxID=5083 RepID=A0AAD6IFY2_PENCN|nr:uncharacterized protein N7446_003112 [Penicillium canescens]KAJ6044916.1 hypothetical protein N7460_006271 [Penicillium canescens]KAJ6056385.1 hypothetical protein N7444_005483 [Penicillium canescens]KAJ6075335.1 hypothetical protein N7446_003112 [Penicillium canescens]